MSEDTLYVAHDALSRLNLEEKAELRPFSVAYQINGRLTIYATDAETAQFLADTTPLSQLAEQGELEMFTPEGMQ